MPEIAGAYLLIFLALGAVIFFFGFPMLLFGNPEVKEGEEISNRDIGGILTVVGVIIALAAGIGYLDTSLRKTVTEEHPLQALSYQTSIEGKFNAEGNFLYYAGRGYLGEKEVYKYLRLENDEAGESFSTLVTEEVGQVRIYQKDNVQPVERRIYEVSGLGDKNLVRVELIVPSGTVTEGFKVDINNNSSQ